MPNNCTMVQLRHAWCNWCNYAMLGAIGAITSCLVQLVQLRHAWCNREIHMNYPERESKTIEFKSAV
ncbi:MAG: hypothetical protein AAGG80_00810 [Pseudomonadota bacterium]